MPWFWVTPQGVEWLMLVVIGVLGGVTQVLLAMAIKAAPVSVTMPLNYLALVLAAGLDITVWGVYPSATTVAGAALIVATGLFIVYRESDPGTRARLRAWLARRPGAP